MIFTALVLGTLLTMALLEEKIYKFPDFEKDSILIPLFFLLGEWAIAFGVSFAVALAIKEMISFIKKHLRVFVAVLMIASVCFGSWCFYKYKFPTSIVPLSGKSAIGGDYKDVYNQFCNAGFDHVSTKALNDLLSADLKQNGEVDAVTIDGVEDFSENDEAETHASIVISYHSALEEKCPVSSKDAKGENYQDILKKFVDSGFTNVSAVADNDLVFGIFAKEGTVKK